MEILNPSEIISERFDDARSLIRDAYQSRNNWKSFYGITTAAEAYARGDIEIHLHFLIHRNSMLPIPKIKERDAAFGKGHNMTNFCIWIQRHPFVEFASSADVSLKTESTHYRSQDGDEAMLVGIVKILKKKKGTAPMLIPSLVWLKFLDTCPETLVHTLETAQTTSLSPKVGDKVAVCLAPYCFSDNVYRKCSMVIGCGVAQEGELPDQKVKCRAEVMGNLPNNRSPLIGKCWTIVNPNVLTPSFSIELGQDDSIAIVFEEYLSSRLQAYDLALCPLDLSSWPDQCMHSKTIQRNKHIV